MSADISASTLFHVEGLVAVITGGGTGTSNYICRSTNPFLTTIKVLV